MGSQTVFHFNRENIIVFNNINSIAINDKYNGSNGRKSDQCIGLGNGSRVDTTDRAASDQRLCYIIANIWGRDYRGGRLQFIEINFRENLINSFDNFVCPCQLCAVSVGVTQIVFIITIICTGAGHKYRHKALI